MSEKAFGVGFNPGLRRRLRRVEPAKVALLVSSEYEGIFRNGGIGTYYKSLSEQLAADNWYVILLLTYSDQVFGGKPFLEPLKHVFSTKETEKVLSLRTAHRWLLTDRAPSVYDRHGLCCQFFTQAVLECFPDARVYVEFPEMLGAAHHLIQAKHAGLLEDRCVIAVTMHGGHEWVIEANEKYMPDKPADFWRLASYEALSFEHADLSFFPSHFLRAKVESYGWRASHAAHLPNFVPVLDRSRSRRNDLPRIDEARKPVVFFGRLEERKGLCTFVEALKSLPQSLKPWLHILFVGKVVPLFSTELRHLHSEQYVERELAGELRYHILPDLHSADALRSVSALHDPVVCLTSPEENFPNSALELGQLSLKLVVSDTGGFRETLALVQRATDVYWFEPKSIASLADAISAAVRQEPPSSPVTDEAKIRHINLDLRVRKLARIEEAFRRARKAPVELSSVGVGLVWRDGGEHLIGCLQSLAVQTHPPVEVVVLYATSGDTRIEGILERARQLFPQFRFMKGSATQSPGAARNDLVEATAKSAYFMTLAADSVLLPFAIERLVTAASRSGAAIVSFPRSHVGGKGDLGAGVSSVPGLLATELDENTCHLVSMSLLREYRYLEDSDALTHGWEVVAAALATGALLVHYPYPLCESTPGSSVRTGPAQQFKQRHKLRQYLAQIPSGRWSQRQLQMLLAATQHLQFSGEATSLPNVPVQRVASAIQAREIALYISGRKLVKAIAIKVAKKPGLGRIYRFLANRVLGG